jgi:hypothetical protein
MAIEAQYSQIIAHVFAKHYKRGANEVVFDREEIVDAAQKLGLPRLRTSEMSFIHFDFEKLFQNRLRRPRRKVLSGYSERLVQVVTGLSSVGNGLSRPIRTAASLRCRMQHLA